MPTARGENQGSGRSRRDPACEGMRHVCQPFARYLAVAEGRDGRLGRCGGAARHDADGGARGRERPWRHRHRVDRDERGFPAAAWRHTNQRHRPGRSWPLRRSGGRPFRLGWPSFGAPPRPSAPDREWPRCGFGGVARSVSSRRRRRSRLAPGAPPPPHVLAAEAAVPGKQGVTGGARTRAAGRGSRPWSS